MPVVESSTKLSDKSIAIPFKGKLFPLVVRYSPVISSRTLLKENNLEITISQSSAPGFNFSLIESQVENWLKAQARRSFCEEVEKQSQKYGFKYNDVSIKDTRSRWGSCSSRGNLNFNWRLVMAPDEILKYVVTHETAHLSHLNHSADFWQLVEQRFPGCQNAKNWLKIHGASLMNWKFQASS